MPFLDCPSPNLFLSGLSPWNNAAHIRAVLAFCFVLFCFPNIRCPDLENFSQNEPRGLFPWQFSTSWINHIRLVNILLEMGVCCGFDTWSLGPYVKWPVEAFGDNRALETWDFLGRPLRPLREDKDPGPCSFFLCFRERTTGKLPHALPGMN